MDEYARARQAARLDTDAERGLADVFDRTMAIVTRLLGPASGSSASGDAAPAWTAPPR